MKKRFQTQIFNLGMRIATIFPRSVAITIAKIILTVGFLFIPKVRAVIRKNLTYTKQKNSLGDTLKTFHNYAVYIVDLLRIPIFDKDSFKDKVEAKGLENLDKALAFNRGVVLITGHLGNWDLAGVYIASLGYPLTAVVEEIPGLSDFYNFLRSSTGMETVFMRERDKMIASLGNNRILALLGDRDLTGRGLKVKFLSGAKNVPRGTSSFALKYNTVINFGYFVLNPDKKSKKLYKVEISEPFIPQNETHEELLQIIADRLSNYIRQYPTQWLVFRDEWIK